MPWISVSGDNDEKLKLLKLSKIVLRNVNELNLKAHHNSVLFFASKVSFIHIIPAIMLCIFR